MKVKPFSQDPTNFSSKVDETVENFLTQIHDLIRLVGEKHLIFLLFIYQMPNSRCQTVDAKLCE